jgi:hypothetical protein
MRIILHIGQQKTGTTALQHALVADRERLAQAGICYPDTGHHRILGGGLDPSHNGLFFRLQGETGRRMWQTLDEMRDDIAREVAAAQPEVLLISAEHAIMAADQKADILAGLDAIVPGPKEVVVYLRRPDAFLQSFHKQLIRLGRRSLASLHTPEAMDVIEATCQLDHRRALKLYLDRYGNAELIDYDRTGDTIEHFYRHVLQLEAPAERPSATNPSIPSVFTDLALEHLRTKGPLAGPRLEALFAHGERESVDLLGPANRERCLSFYEEQNTFLGSLVARPEFFDDLDAMISVGPEVLTVAEANTRYRTTFDALVSSPGLHELRRDCRLLESLGHHDAAAALFESHRHSLADDAIETFRRDLETSSRGRFTLERGRYRRVVDEPGPVPPRLTRIARHVGRRVRSVARRVVSRVQQRAGGSTGT